jgi:hypothetical protein
MNSPRFSLSLPHANRSHARARLSPLVRGVTHDALARHRVAARLARMTSEAEALHEEMAAPNSSTARSGWWDPNLLDRLEPPLTRFRE